jgi:hypothetical protein
VAFRLTGSAGYRSGSVVLLHDPGPLLSVAALRAALAEIDDVVDTHGDLIAEGGAELIVRITERRFEPMEPRAEPPQRKRIPLPGRV